MLFFSGVNLKQLEVTLETDASLVRTLREVMAESYPKELINSVK